MAAPQALTATVEGYLRRLREQAQSHEVPIEATLWQYDARADLIELTVVSRRKAYIFSLPAIDFADLHYAALYTELIRLLLRAIKENLPLVSMRVPPSALESDRPALGSAVAASTRGFAAKAS